MDFNIPESVSLTVESRKSQNFMTTELKMKLFTVEEANEALTDVAARLRKIQTLYAEIGELRESASAAAAASNFGGGMIGGSDYVEALYNVGKLTTELNDEGVQLKDYTRGLIDFPSIRDGRMVLLCWQLGEPERIEWWHEVEAGFAGRQPL